MGPRGMEGEKSHRVMKAYSAEFGADGVAPYLPDHAPVAEKPTEAPSFGLGSFPAGRGDQVCERHVACHSGAP